MHKNSPWLCFEPFDNYIVKEVMVIFSPLFFYVIFITLEEHFQRTEPLMISAPLCSVLQMRFKKELWTFIRTKTKN